VFEKTPVRHGGYSLYKYFFRRFVMRNKLILNLLLIAAGGMGMVGTAGCDNGTGTASSGPATKFEGVWKTDNESDYWEYRFSGNTVNAKHGGSSAEQFAWSGTFSFTDVTITFNPVSSVPAMELNSWTQPYQFLESPARLKLVNEGLQDVIGGEFIKQ
jgi:hypothetical protein